MVDKVDSQVAVRQGEAFEDSLPLAVGRWGMAEMDRVVMVDTARMDLQCVVVEVVDRSMDIPVVAASMNPFYNAMILNSCAIK